MQISGLAGIYTIALPILLFSLLKYILLNFLTDLQKIVP